MRIISAFQSSGLFKKIFYTNSRCKSRIFLLPGVQYLGRNLVKYTDIKIFQFLPFSVDIILEEEANTDRDVQESSGSTTCYSSHFLKYHSRKDLDSHIELERMLEFVEISWGNYQY